MSRKLSTLLGAKEPDFSNQIRDWETRSPNQSHDVRLISDINGRIKNAIKNHDLDDEDTTPKELYFALLERARKDSVALGDLLDISPSDTPSGMIKKIAKWLEKIDLHRDLWVIKSSTIKSYLKKQPPKTLMKALGLRSVDSMLKHNDPSDLIALAALVEKPDWIAKFRSEYRRLRPQDFQSTKASIHVLKQNQVAKLKKGGLRTTRIVSPCYETGVIVVITPERRFDADVLTLVTSLVETIADMRRHSAYFRLISTQNKFGAVIADVCNLGLGGASIAHNNFHWNPIHKHLVGNEDYMGSVEQPHFTHEDLKIVHSTTVLSELDPRFVFWNGNEHVLYVDDALSPVSLHVADVSVNASNQSNFESASRAYARSRLWDQLWSSYFTSEPIRDEVVGSFLHQDKL